MRMNDSDKIWNTWATPRDLYFSLIVLTSIGIFWRSLVLVFSTASYNDEYSHILLVLPVVIALLFSERSTVFQRTEYCATAGFFLVLLMLIFAWFVRHPFTLSLNDTLSLRMAFFTGGVVLGFIFCFGIAAARAAAFPLLFLFLMVPIPDFLLERIIWLLQKCSTEVTFLMMKAARIPVSKRGFVLSLPEFDIEVARECSSIRSSMLLLVVSLVLAHRFLRQGWRRLLVVLLVFPIAVAKNGLRIFTISALGSNVDRSFMTGNLHRHGGVLFFLLAVAVVTLVVWWLRSSEEEGLNLDQDSGRPSDLPSR
jgi:exosortase